MIFLTKKTLNEEIQKHDEDIQKLYEEKFQKQNDDFQQKLNDLEKAYDKKLNKANKEYNSKLKDIKKKSLIGGFPTRYTNWIFAGLTKVNSDINTNYIEVIKKCRFLAKNNPIVRSYLSSCVKNIVR